jgi:hypothetical protein
MKSNQLETGPMLSSVMGFNMDEDEKSEGSKGMQRLVKRRIDEGTSDI